MSKYRHVELRLRALRHMFEGRPAKLVEDSVRYDRPDGQTEIAYLAEDDVPATFTVPDVLLSDDGQDD
jgi:hypothetical protein